MEREGKVCESNCEEYYISKRSKKGYKIEYKKGKRIVNILTCFDRKNLWVKKSESFGIFETV